MAAFWRYGTDLNNIAGQVFAIIVFAVAAAEVSVGGSLAGGAGVYLGVAEGLSGRAAFVAQIVYLRLTANTQVNKLRYEFLVDAAQFFR